MKYKNKKQRKIKTKEQIEIFSRIGMLLNAGVSISDAIHAMSLDISSKNTNAILNDWYTNIKNGSSLSKMFIDNDYGIDKSMLGYISLGESSGQLPESIKSGVKNLQHKKSLREKIINSLIYPVLISIFSISVVFFLLTYIVPKISSIFLTLNMDLPFITRLLIDLSSWFKSNLLLISISLAIFCVINIYALRKIQTFRFFAQYLLIKSPIVGGMLKLNALSVFFHHLSTLLGVGMPLPDALSLGSKNISILPIQKSLLSLVKKVESGKSLSVSMGEIPEMFDSSDIAVMRAGDGSGSQRESMDYISKEKEETLQNLIKRATALSEPLIMIVIGLLVGGIALAMIIPIYEITQKITYQ